MKSETKTCQNCKKEFTIESEDFDFYKKVKVPAPTFCWLCRAQRRFMFRNYRAVYKRKSDYTSKEIFSMFSPENPVKVYEREIWRSDAWDGLEYGRAYDFSKPFFEQLKELSVAVPRFNLAVQNMIHSEYCNNFNDAKNCYLVFGGGFAENCLYSYRIVHSKDCVDTSYIFKGELCYNSLNISNGYKVFFCVDCENSNEIYFSKNLRGCSHCFGCVNLTNKQYHIFNKPYSKDKYFQRLKNIDYGSYQSVQHLLQKVYAFWLQFPNKYMHGRHNYNVSGDYIYNSKNTFFSHNIKSAEDIKYCQDADIPTVKSCYDYSIFGENVELLYECAECGLGAYNLKFCHMTWDNVSDCIYCMYCVGSCSYCFGCVGLKNKQYCILNKQYTKEEYETLVPKIIQHMNDMPYKDKKGRIYKYGEFFPPEFSLFAYNETLAQKYFPLTKSQAREQGYIWKDSDKRGYGTTIKSESLPDHIKKVNNDILDQVIGCEHQGKCNEQCTTAFKIIPDELQFYRKMNIPLPRLCYNCRHHQRLKQHNPLKLWHRKCQCAGEKSDNKVYQNTTKHFHGTDHCPNEFETTYTPERKEIIYCEKCYQSEIV